MNAWGRCAAQHTRRKFSAHLYIVPRSRWRRPRSRRACQRAGRTLWRWRSCGPAPRATPARGRSRPRFWTRAAASGWEPCRASPWRAQTARPARSSPAQRPGAAATCAALTVRGPAPRRRGGVRPEHLPPSRAPAACRMCGVPIGLPQRCLSQTRGCCAADAPRVGADALPSGRAGDLAGRTAGPTPERLLLPPARPGAALVHPLGVHLTARGVTAYARAAGCGGAAGGRGAGGLLLISHALDGRGGARGRMAALPDAVVVPWGGAFARTPCPSALRRGIAAALSQPSAPRAGKLAALRLPPARGRQRLGGSSRQPRASHCRPAARRMSLQPRMAVLKFFFFRGEGGGG